MNKYGRTELTGMHRNQDPKVCGIGTLALYYFDRRDLRREPVPSLATRASWHRIVAFTYRSQTDQDPYMYGRICKALLAFIAPSGRTNGSGVWCHCGIH